MILPPTLNTERLTVRPMTLQDAKAFFRLRSDPEMVRYWAHPPLSSLDEAVPMVRSAVEDMAAGHSLSLVADVLGGPACVATLSLHNISTQNRRGEIGYSLAREHQGRGLMREALTAFIDHLFVREGLIRLEADIHPDNEPSRRTLLALGFKREGYMPERWIVGGEVSDSEVFGLLARDWGSAKAAG